MRNRKKKKNNYKLVNIIISIGIIFLIASLVIMLLNNKKIDNHIVDINYEKYSELISKNEYSIILLTSPTCTHCNDYKPYVNYVCDDNNLVVYNLNINELSYEEYMEIHDMYSATVDNYINGNPSILTPTTVITRNGEEVVSISGNLGYRGLVDLLKQNGIIKKWFVNHFFYPLLSVDSCGVVCGVDWGVDSGVGAGFSFTIIVLDTVPE